MTDIVDKITRSRMMAGIRGKNTKPELMIRSGLHRRGFRYRLHDKRLPGRPDIVLPKYRAIILIHGCFWHGHGCHLFKWPKTRADFWKQKIHSNIERDRRNIAIYRHAGWRVLTIWECSLRDKPVKTLEATIEKINNWIVAPNTNPLSSSDDEIPAGG